MTDLPSVEAYIQTEATRFRSAVSESLAQDMGSAINYLNDQDAIAQAHFAAIATNTFGLITGSGSSTNATVGFSVTTDADEYAWVFFGGTFQGGGSSTVVTLTFNGVAFPTVQPFITTSAVITQFVTPLTYVLPPSSTITVTNGHGYSYIVMKNANIVT